MADDCSTRLIDPKVKEKLFGGRDIPDRVLKEWLDGVQGIKDAFDQGMIDSKTFNDRANQYITERRVAAEAQAAIRLLDAQRLKKARGFLRQEGFSGGNAAEGFHAILTKSTKMGNESALSIHAKERAYLGKYADFLRNSLVSTDTMQLAISGQLDREIAAVIAAVNNGKEMPKVPAEAVVIGRAFADVQTMAFIDMQGAGIPVRNLRRRVSLQTHNPVGIKKVGFEQWFNDVMALKPDLTALGPKALTPKGLQGAMRGIYDDIVAGRYGIMDTVQDGQLIDALAPGRISESAAKSKVLHFEPESHVKYMQMYGNRETLMQAIFADVSSKAKKTAMFERLGDKPRENFVGLIDKEIRRRDKLGDEKGLSILKRDRERLINEFDQLSGALSIPSNETLGKIGSFIGSLETVSKLGAIGVRAVANLATAFTDIQATTGKSFGSAVGSMTSEAIKAIPDAVRTVWSKRYADVIDVMQGQMRQQMLGSGVTGSMARMADFQLKINGHHILNNAFRTAVSVINQMEWADNAGKKFSDIPPGLQAAMLQAGIDEHDWGLFAHATRKGARDITIVPTESFGRDAKFPPGVVERAMEAKGFEGTPEAYLRGIEANLRAFLLQRGDVVTTTAGPREASRLNNGTQAGTPEGEFFRMMMRFKSFTAQSMLISRTFLNADPNKELLAAGILSSKPGSTSSMRLLAQYSIVGSVLAYMGDSLIRTAAGKDVNDPLAGGTWVDAISKSGMGGMQVDFFTGNWEKYSFAEAALGPTLGTIAGQGARAVSQIREGQGREAAKTGANIVRGYVPFQQVVGAKLAIDYAHREIIEDLIDPGSAERRRLRNIRESRRND